MFLCKLAIHASSKLWVTVQGAMELMDTSGFLLMITVAGNKADH